MSTIYLDIRVYLVSLPPAYPHSCCGRAGFHDKETC